MAAAVLFGGCVPPSGTGQPPPAPPPIGVPVEGDATRPSSPSGLFITSFLRIPPEYDLRWIAAANTVTVDHFNVYQSGASITDDNKATAFLASVPAAVNAAAITLHLDSGVQHFRVSAVSAGGVEGPLSNEYRVNTASRLAVRADKFQDELFELFVVSSGGGDAARVSGAVLPGRTVSKFAWSPDGFNVAFLSDLRSAGVVELFVAPADGSIAPTAVSGTLAPGGNVTSFAWAPQGTHLAFVADKHIDEVFELYVTSASPNATPLQISDVNAPRGGKFDGVTSFAWSTDGALLAWVADARRNDVYELFVARSSGGEVRRVSGEMPALGGAFDGVAKFSWSPDGSQLAYLADQQLDDVPELFVTSSLAELSVKVSGSVVQGGKVAEFAWSPDSVQLAFLADRNIAGQNKLYTVSAIDGLPIDVSGSTIPDGDVLPGFRWSPDAVHVAFRANRENKDIIGLYVVAAGGGEVTRVSGALDPALKLSEDFEWSPDASRLAIGGTQTFVNATDLYTNSLAGDEPVRVNPPLPSGRDVKKLVWAPDGTQLGYIADQLIDEQFELFVIPAAGGESRRVSGNLITDGDVTDTAWSRLSN